MELIKLFKRVFVILFVLIVLGGNISYANESTVNDSDEQTGLEKIEIDAIKTKLNDKLQATKDNYEIKRNFKLIEKYPDHLGTPAVRTLSNSQASSAVKKFGYRDAHHFKKELVKREKDKTISHYNISQVTKSGKIEKRGDIYLHHRSTNNFYVTGYNYYKPDGYFPIEL